MASFHFVNSIALNTINHARREITEAIQRDSISNAAVLLDFSQIPIHIRILSSPNDNTQSVADYHLAIENNSNPFVVHIQLPAGNGKKGWAQTRDVDMHSADREKVLSQPLGRHCEPYVIKVVSISLSLLTPSY